MLILLVFKKYKEIEKSKFAKNKEIKGSMCFGDQTTLPINRGHNAKKGGAILRQKMRAIKRKNLNLKHLYRSRPP